jgi:predicted CXXCH cytochrome family protein
MVTNDICVDCHRDLGSLGVALTGRFDPTVEDFAATGGESEHPEFTVPSGVEGVAETDRVRLSDRERAGDPTLLWLRHDIHLRPDLKSRSGERQLTCQDCHAYDSATGEIAPLQFESHCEECHPLEFGQGPVRAPHATGQEVHAFLLSYYAALDNPKVAAPLPERRRRALPRQPVSGVVRPDISPQVLFRVTQAEAKLFGDNSACDKCHLVARTGVVPDVEPLGRPRPWFLHGRFPHAPHRMRDCESCHQRARTSERTEDVLVPGIQLCRACHGADATEDSTAAASSPGATTRCVSCHTYHDKSKVGWEARRVVDADVDPIAR